MDQHRPKCPKQHLEGRKRRQKNLWPGRALFCVRIETKSTVLNSNHTLSFKSIQQASLKPNDHLSKKSPLSSHSELISGMIHVNITASFHQSTTSGRIGQIFRESIDLNQFNALQVRFIRPAFGCCFGKPPESSTLRNRTPCTRTPKPLQQ